MPNDRSSPPMAHKPGRSRWHAALLLLGVLGLRGPALAAEAEGQAAAVERDALSQRVQVVRQALARLEDPAADPDSPVARWVAWSNWGNWPKWPNWANWFNR